MKYTETLESFRLMSRNGILLYLTYDEIFGAVEPEAEPSGD